MARAAQPLTFNTLPAWAMPATPSRLSLYEVIALAGLEGQWIRLSAADQKAVMGHNVFGKQTFCVSADGVVTVSRTVCFGTSGEQHEYTPADIGRALELGKKVSPGRWGGAYIG